jgi:DNA polymerase III epsilon subunit-like protein
MAKDLHPGKKNNLNALCERYGVDNSQRTLHGALLDAEILAEVYLAMTRGQESLIIDLGDDVVSAAGRQASGLRAGHPRLLQVGQRAAAGRAAGQGALVHSSAVQDADRYRVHPGAAPAADRAVCPKTGPTHGFPERA